MSPPNLRDLVGDIREAVERYSREQLVEVLIYVFKQYVVEGPAPLASTPAQLQDDLAGMSFAELITSLQLRLDLPELELFDVQGERVYVRAGGRATAIELPPSRTSPAPVPAPMAVPETPAPAAPGVTLTPSSPGTLPRVTPRTSIEEVVLTRAPGSRGAPESRSAPAPAAGSPPPAAASPSAPASRAATAATPATKPADPPVDDARRGGLLEID